MSKPETFAGIFRDNFCAEHKSNTVVVCQKCFERVISTAVSYARAEEREECAKVCDDWPKSVDRMAFVMGGARAYVLESQKIAAAIRARAAAKGGG